MNRLAAVAREPLVQFMVIGALIAAIYAVLPTDKVLVEDDVIVLNEGRVDQLSKLFERTWNRPPTDAELEGIVDAFLREEILFRAGSELGLAEDDVVVRRRIAQKMQFLLEPDPTNLTPSDADLAAHLAANRDAFRIEPQIAFEQVFFDEARHGENVEDVVASARDALASGAAPTDVGDSTLLPARFDGGRIGEVARHLGSTFANEILTLPVGEWAGPVRSPFGLHLVRVSQKNPARDPALAEVRERVAQSWRAEGREDVAKTRYDELAARFRVIRETPERGALSPGTQGEPAARDGAR